MKGKQKQSSKSRWELSEISYQLGSEENCKCSLLNWRDKKADWMMCPECGRIWVRKEPRHA